MARLPRLKVRGERGWYHLCARVAGYREDRPLADPVVRDRLLRLIRHYASAYFCQVAGFCVMGNHYHLVIAFEAERDVPAEDLRRRARILYPAEGGCGDPDCWPEERWTRFRKRLFDVSEFMRNVQSAFAHWYNRQHGRRGRLWADRFRSVILGDDRALVDCLLYVELNPVRAGLVERPEDWRGSSAWLRAAGMDGWLAPLEDLLGAPSHKVAVREHRQMLYHRGAIPTRPGQAAIPEELLRREAERGFAARGVFLKRLRYFVDGVAVGTEAFVREQIAALREVDRCVRPREPVPQLGGVHLSLRAQRAGGVAF